MSNIDKLYNDIVDDAGDISKFAIQTPLIRLPWLDAPGRTVWAKLENKQLTNSFKVRGAFNAARKIDPSVPLVTASAGNHGLAIAYVAEKLKRKSKIYVPANASEVKLRRLINMGADVIPVGRDLHEATEIAKATSEGQFISPFSHMDVIRGQGSLALEVLKQSEVPYDNVLVPLGGGGLLAGVSTVFKRNTPGVKITGLHPQAFQRDFSSGFTNALSKAVYPTIADGLAVQHSDVDFTSSIVEKLTDEIDNISEHDIELAVAATLYNEGLLVEGAGAIGIAALINDPTGQKYTGNTLVLVCGGNISTSSLMQALATYTSNESLAKLTGHRSAQLPSEAVQYDKSITLSGIANSNFSQQPIGRSIWKELISNVEKDLNKFRSDLSRHTEFADGRNLSYKPGLISHITDEITTADNLVKYCKEECKTDDEVRAGFRVLLQHYAFLRNSLSWCSASSDQSGQIMFFDPAENASSAVNYDRYGSILLRERELSLLKALGHDSDNVDLLMTSSGQAAYSVIESFLLREKLSANPKVVTSPYIYFEALEQIQSLKNIDFHQSESWDMNDIVDTVETRNADVLFIDPMANLGSLKVTDFNKFADILGDKDWSKKWLVVDGTMVSGGVDIFNIFNKPNHPQVLYYESGSKYLQFGMDLQMAGIVVAGKEHSSLLAKNRRNTGGVMYQSGVLKFPKYDRDQFLARLSTLTDNAATLRDMLSSWDPDQKKMEVAYPANWKEMGWSHGGGIVSLMMKDDGLNNRACLDYLIDLIMNQCRHENVPLTKGVSFGFSTTRISAAAAMANDMPPFLRFSIGEESPEVMRKLGNIIIQSLDTFFKTYSPEQARKQDNTQLAIPTLDI